MGVILVVLAGIICLVYTSYFIRIMRGDPQGFEVQMIKALAEWIITKGAVSKRYIWAMFFLSLLVEMLYFWLTIVLINNPVMIALTALFIAVESYHLIRIAVSLNRFFIGKALLSHIFNWRVERASAIFFFTHSFLVLAILIFF
ncbi:MAG: hypothetical protein CVU90_13515 [Firmicutes bacterium HGW-Firmicutes-15]|nr:MAG: hypothetical protein CVU90_13515 [Firmicutes bacterium HGW-Firmicutes-15]